jgi:hypothetical protein
VQPAAAGQVRFPAVGGEKRMALQEWSKVIRGANIKGE